jgi:hypothetical protein
MFLTQNKAMIIMPHQPKERAEMLQRFNARRKATRREGFGDFAIILGSKGGITRKKVDQVVERLRQRKEAHLKEKIAQLYAADKIPLRKESNVTSTQLATRFSLKYLMKPLELMRITGQQSKIFKSILLHRRQYIKGTTIEIRPRAEFLIMELANSFGKNGCQKALPFAEALSKRGKNFKEMAHKATTKSDTFLNVAQLATGPEIMLNSMNFLIQEIPSLISERRHELAKLREINTPRKEMYVELIEEELKRAELNYDLYKRNNK